VVEWVSTLDVSTLEASPGEDFSFVIHSISKPSCPVKVFFLNLGFDIRETTPNPFFEEKNMVFKKKNGKKKLLAPSIFFFKAQFSSRFYRPTGQPGRAECKIPTARSTML
jgi:hypothetical protein